MSKKKLKGMSLYTLDARGEKCSPNLGWQWFEVQMAGDRNHRFRDCRYSTTETAREQRLRRLAKRNDLVFKKARKPFVESGVLTRSTMPLTIIIRSMSN